MSRAELCRHIDASTCLVLPSRSEGLGRVILEAMGRERPVVASAVGGIVELVEPGVTGILVPPEDAGALADALVELLGRPAAARAMGKKPVDEPGHEIRCAEYEQGIARLAEWMAGS